MTYLDVPEVIIIDYFFQTLDFLIILKYISFYTYCKIFQKETGFLAGKDKSVMMSAKNPAGIVITTNKVSLSPVQKSQMR